MTRLPDLADRERAVSTFDGTVVVTASAGTGKTTLLVERALHLLLGERRAGPGLVLPIEPEHLLAATFAEKAAGTMRRRLRDALRSLAAAPPALEGWLREAEARLRRVHGIGADRVRDRARRVLAALDRAQITTLHSLAAEVVRSFPREAGADPSFEVDASGEAFDRLFEERWEDLLGGALEAGGEEARERWMRVLEAAGERDLRAAARSLCGLGIPGEALEGIFRPPWGEAFDRWMSETRARAANLAAFARSQAETRNVEKVVLACARLLGAEGEGIPLGDPAFAAGAEALENLGKAPKGWDEARHREAKRLARRVRALAAWEPRLGEDFEAVLLPFARRFREEYLRRGFLSFDGLLSLAASVLRRARRVREALQRRYRAILVDEVQDTDPAQVEIVLYLAEAEGSFAGRAEDAAIAPGKLFVVGDEKQSIYGFRGADPGASRLLAGRARGSGAECTLRTSFRSAPEVLAAVNEVFSRLFVEGPCQPAYAPLEAGPADAAGEAPPAGVEIRVWHGGAEKPLAEDAAEGEAEGVAAVLRGLRGDGFAWKEMAVLFRTFTRGHVYLDALKRHGVPYTSEGEKFFYTAPEVLDFVNLLAALADPGDRLALVGVLRSPLGAFSDRDLAALAEANALDFRRDPPESLPCAARARALYASLRRAGEEARREPLEAFVDGLFERLPLVEIAGAAGRGAQTAANVVKLRAVARTLASDPRTTLARLVAALRQRGEAAFEEGEAPVFEEGVDAVRVLTIHKAKGLEFDAVVLPGAHAGRRSGSEPSGGATHERLVSTSGMRIREWRTPPAVFLEDRSLERDEAERLRTHYVGWTRARRRLVVSGAIAKRSSGSFLDALYGPSVFGEALSEALPDSKPVERERRLGVGTFREIFAPAPRPLRGRRKGEKAAFAAPAPEGIERACAARRAEFEAAKKSPLLVAASKLGREDDEPLDSAEAGAPPGAEEGFVPERPGPGRDRARRLGTLCHRVLERWTFGDPLERLGEAVEEAAGAEGLGEEEAEGLRAETRRILEGFLRSPVGLELARVEILARELPVLVELDGRFVRGAADLVFRDRDGRVFVADYKTDDVDSAGASMRAESYRRPLAAYAEAVRSALDLPEVDTVLLFVRGPTRVRLSNGPGFERDRT